MWVSMCMENLGGILGEVIGVLSNVVLCSRDINEVREAVGEELSK